MAKQWWQYEQNPDDDPDVDASVFGEAEGDDEERVDNEANRLVIGVLGHPNAGKR